MLFFATYFRYCPPDDSGFLRGINNAGVGVWRFFRLNNVSRSVCRVELETHKEETGWTFLPDNNSAGAAEFLPRGFSQ